MVQNYFTTNKLGEVKTKQGKLFGKNVNWYVGLRALTGDINNSGDSSEGEDE